MNVTGINGRDGNVLGLIDSGADKTCFPLAYASLMGYAPTDLDQVVSTGIGGATVTHVAKQPSTMFVVGLPHIIIDIWPLFLPGGQMVLWGRSDFMTRYDIGIMEKAQQFSITPDMDLPPPQSSS